MFELADRLVRAYKTSDECKTLAISPFHLLILDQIIRFLEMISFVKFSLEKIKLRKIRHINSFGRGFCRKRMEGVTIHRRRRGGVPPDFWSNDTPILIFFDSNMLSNVNFTL